MIAIVLPDDAGIYELLNLKNNKRYIGKSVNLKSRVSQHLRDLRKGIHQNKYLQDDFNRYGEKNFKASILKTCKEEELDVYESVFCYENDVWDRRRGYNIAKLRNLQNVKVKEIQFKNNILENLFADGTLVEFINKHGETELPFWWVSQTTGMDEDLIKIALKKLSKEDNERFSCTFKVKRGWESLLLVRSLKREMQIKETLMKRINAL